MSETVFHALLNHEQLPIPKAEHKFHPTRKWRFDYAWVKQKVALEVDGGIWTQGRHTRGAGYLRDMEKRNTATIMGWKVLHCTPQTLCSIQTIELLKAVL